MGRASKLKAERKKQEPKAVTYNFSLEQLNAIRDAAVDKAVAEALELMLGIPAMVLTDKFGFNADQLDTFIDKCSELHDSVCSGYLTLDDIRTALYEECGARIQLIGHAKRKEQNMDKEKFDKEVTKLSANCDRVMGYKNDNLYAKDAKDKLHNFKTGAEISGLTPAQVAWGYMTKHIAALRDMVLRNDFSNLGELEEKCTDMINYTRFIYCIGVEDHDKKNESEEQ